MISSNGMAAFKQGKWSQKHITNTYAFCFRELIDWLVAAVTRTRFPQHRDLQEISPLLETSVTKNTISVSELPLVQNAQTEDRSLQFQSQR